MLRKFYNIIKQGYVSLVNDDSLAYPSAQYTQNKKAGKFTRLSVYGICSNPPKDSHILLFSSQGQESVKFGIINDFINRKKNLKEGECGLLNTKTGTIVFLSEDSKIAIGNPALPFTSTPTASSGLELLELMDRFLTAMAASSDTNTDSLDAATVAEIGKIKVDLNLLKGSL